VRYSIDSGVERCVVAAGWEERCAGAGYWREDTVLRRAFVARLGDNERAKGGETGSRERKRERERARERERERERGGRKSQDKSVRILVAAGEKKEAARIGGPAGVDASRRERRKQSEKTRSGEGQNTRKEGRTGGEKREAGEHESRPERRKGQRGKENHRSVDAARRERGR
jgi:hypothetical protein